MILEDIVYYLAIGSSIFFVVQVIMSFMVDLDTDFDFDASVGVSDFMSFKGGLHFLLGFSWMGVLNGVENVQKTLIAVGVGVLFVIVLAFVYRKVYSLAEERTYQKPNELIGTECEILTFYNGTGTINITFNSRKTEMYVKSSQPLKSGDLVKILDYQDGFFIVEKQ